MPQTATTTNTAWMPKEIAPIANYVIANPAQVSLFLLLGAAYAILMRDGKSAKAKLTKGKWAGSKEKGAREKAGLQQLANPKRNFFTLFINSPKSLRKSKLRIDMLAKLPKQYHSKKKTNESEFLPNAATSFLVAGKAGCGKSYTIIDRLIQSALSQGLPVLIYDFKYPTQAMYSLLARLYGYQVYFFVPGEEETHYINLLDFVDSPADSIGAANLVKVISMNLNAGDSGENDFFAQAGSVVIQGSFLLSKWTAQFTGNDHYGDILTASLIASLPNLASRINAINSENSLISRINFSASTPGRHMFANSPPADSAYVGDWVYKPFEQLLRAHGDSDEYTENKTETSIVATAIGTFEKFVRMSLVPSFCSDGSPTESNRRLPVDIHKKTMYVFGVNRKNRYSVVPLIATLIQSLVDRHIGQSKDKDHGITLFLDELPTAYIPGAIDWPSTARSAGVSLISGIQNQAQLRSRYGDDNTKTMTGSHGSKLLFNPGELGSAQEYSDMIGEEDIVVKEPTSKSRSSGTTTTSHNRSLQQVAMLSPADFLKLKQGEFVLLSEASDDGQQSYIPERMRITLDPQTLLEEKFCADNWDVWIDAIKKERPQLSEQTIDRMIKERKLLLDHLFPEPLAVHNDDNY
jgi:type IV secretory pathway TraG/TraD family ATPase VirD4